MKKIVLSNGVNMPQFGLGTYPMTKSVLENTVHESIKLGYRCFDTASAYGNDISLGNAIHSAGIAREEVFIVSKISNEEQRNGNIEKRYEEMLRRMKMDYIDLLLVHWPNPETYISTWVEMEKIYKKGEVLSIGVSNFEKQHIELLKKHATIMPMINQIELHPLLNQKSLVEYCQKELKIQVMAYAPLARMNNKLMNNEILIELSNKYLKSIPQIVLRWSIELGVITIPKAERVSNLKENINIFDFSLEEKDIKKINLINENFRVGYNPNNCDFTQL